MFRLIFGLCLLLSVYANTEIVNFQVSELYEDEIAVTNSWPVLNHTYAERQLDLIPAPLGSSMEEVCNTGRSNGVDYTACPHELWLLLDLTGNWEKYSRFTLRLSWLASHPVDFSLQIFDAQDLLAHLSQHRNHILNESRPPTHRTRARYARIRAVDIGVLTPYPGSTSSGSTTSQPSPVPFILIVEPLYFGFLPPTVVPVLWYIVVVVIIACIGLPPLIKYLDGLASQARKELYEDAKPKRE
ncbi:hypothetical protein H0H93_013512 [Arthromyces matolae]|nr:hypothetical protein H0H93_013512 [Arthromyces matolae]